MRHTPSDRYYWILHIKDHWSKYSQLYPLQGKEASPIADYIALWIMAFFPMKFLGAPRSPQTQGLVEKGNDEVEKKITKWKLDHGTNKWHYSLVEVALQINSQYHRTIGGHSFEVVFRHKKPINWLTHEEERQLVV